YRLLTGASIPPAAKLLYSYLLDRAGGRNGAVLLSSTRLASAVGLSTSAVRRNLHRLQQHGLIRLTPRYSEEGIRLTDRMTYGCGGATADSRVTASGRACREYGRRGFGSSRALGRCITVGSVEL